MILLPLTYLGPVQFYCRFFTSDKLLIEQHDSYQKQSYRNRCDIYGANGKLSLSIPVQHESGIRQKTMEVKIDYATDWRKLHWKGIESAYNSSPYFEYYRDIFEPYYRKETILLLDFCIQLHKEVLKILRIPDKQELTRDFYPPLTQQKRGKEFKEVLGNREDLRSLIHPKCSTENDPEFRIIEYTQVFSQNHGFIPNLSILDLLFNMGPESGSLLKASHK